MNISIGIAHFSNNTYTEISTCCDSMGLLLVVHELQRGIDSVFPTLNFYGFFIGSSTFWKGSGRGSGKGSGRGAGRPEWYVPALCQNHHFVKGL